MDCAAEYIADTVYQMLNRSLEYDWRKWGFLDELNNDQEIEEINIFTLNHDLLLEKYFADHSIDYCNGFGDEQSLGNEEGISMGSARYWEPGKLSKSRERIKLVKLHGSLDWYEKNGAIVIPNKSALENIIDWNAPQMHSFDKPAILIGTTNKFRKYLAPTFLESFMYFHNTLY